MHSLTRPDRAPETNLSDAIRPIMLGVAAAVTVIHAFSPSPDTVVAAPPAAAVAPVLPHGTPNFDPDLTLAGQFDVQLTDTPGEPRQADSSVIQSGYTYGYATRHTVHGQPGIELFAGGKLSIGAGGDVKVDSLYGPRETTIAPAQLGKGPTSVSLGDGDYVFEIGLSPIDREPEIWRGTKDQQPFPGTFVGQPGPINPA